MAFAGWAASAGSACTPPLQAAPFGSHSKAACMCKNWVRCVCYDEEKHTICSLINAATNSHFLWSNCDKHTQLGAHFFTLILFSPLFNHTDVYFTCHFSLPLSPHHEFCPLLKSFTCKKKKDLSRQRRKCLCFLLKFAVTAATDAITRNWKLLTRCDYNVATRLVRDESANTLPSCHWTWTKTLLRFTFIYFSFTATDHVVRFFFFFFLRCATK